MATLLHALAALVLGNFRFTSFFERAHSDFQIREPRFNHLIRRVATHFFVASLGILARAGRSWSVPTDGEPTSNLIYVCPEQPLLAPVSKLAPWNKQGRLPKTKDRPNGKIKFPLERGKS
jgi:hypothetical protein